MLSALGDCARSVTQILEQYGHALVDKGLRVEGRCVRGYWGLKSTGRFQLTLRNPVTTRLKSRDKRLGRNHFSSDVLGTIRLQSVFERNLLYRY